MNDRRRSPESAGRAHGALHVRLARPSDAGVIAGFNVRMARETEGLQLTPATVGAGVAAVFDDPARGFYVLAERAGATVGALLVTCEWSDWRNARFWWIQSVYVSPCARRGGVFRALHAFVTARAREHGGVCGVRLYVEKDNRAAQNVYRAMGMRESSYRLFEQEF